MKAIIILKCRKCNGTGIDERYRVTTIARYARCKACNGTGKIEHEILEIKDA